jgi:hypothetical protein
MKVVTVNVWGQLFGTDTKGPTIRGSKEELVDKIQKLSPCKDKGAIMDALSRAVWAPGIEWAGGHQCGVEVVSVLDEPAYAGHGAVR